MYYRTIPANLDVDAIASLLADEEAGGSKFVENKVGPLKTAAGPATLTNIAKFVDLDDQIPPDPALVLHGQAVPNGKTVEWSGVMLVKGTMKVVDVCR
jgi:hypothetical protein